MPRHFYWGVLIVAIAGVTIFFVYNTQTPSVESAAQMAPSLADQAEFGGVSLRIEYATTSEAREHGLGGRTEIQEDYGMLFIFPKDDTYGFWMKDMLLPIDIFWLDSEGHVVSVTQDVATSTYPSVFYPSGPARYVLETAAGFARVHNIITGTSLVLKNLKRVSE
jgi:uncharacterized membrane protein (UPF0127 family)